MTRPDPAAGQVPAAEAKAHLRERVQAWRLHLSRADVERWSAAITGHALAWPPLGRAAVVLAFASLAREPQTGALIAALQARGALVALPRVHGPDMEAWAVPVAGSGAAGDGVVGPTRIDLVLVPGVAFDGRGRRLGRGGGHYDRYLARVAPACVRLGLCFEGQRVPAVPAEAHDQGVDALVTEAGLWEMERRGGP